MLKLLLKNSNINTNNLLPRIILNYSTTATNSKNMDLKNVLKRLEQYANSGLACNWDNVGLLVEPSEKLLVKKILITNDLTEPVLDEALKKKGKLIF